MPDFLFFFERANEVRCFRQLDRGWDEYSELRGQALVGKRQLIGNIDNVASYTVSHDSANVLRKGLSGLNVIERVSLIREKTKWHAHKHLKTMGEGIN